MGESSEIFVHSISETGRLLPSASHWNSIEIDYGLVPTPSHPNDYTPSMCSKSFEFSLSLADKARFKRFVYISIALFIVTIAVPLLMALLTTKHTNDVPSSSLQFALDRALLFFDAQKSGVLPKNNPVKFRGDSGLQDGNSGPTVANLVGGFYDSGSNVKFSFPTAYTITLLSWTVIEYHEKYAAIDQLDHVKDIIKWGSDYLLKAFVPSANSMQPGAFLYSQVGSTNIYTNSENDATCWQRPEDMTYPRPVSTCTSSATDLAGEIVAALAAASLVFNQEKAYSKELIQASERLFELATKNPNKGTYTASEACGGEARDFYNSSSYFDELVWGGTWLFFATGKFSYLDYATETFDRAVKEEAAADGGVFYWNNKLAASAVLLTRLWYLHDPGYPYDPTLKLCSDMTTLLICSYLSQHRKLMSPGGLILLKPNNSAPLQLAATAAFLTKIYNDYLSILQTPVVSCGVSSFPVEKLQSFARSQVSYILGDNPSNMSYLVGFGEQFPQQVHHRGASIPTDGRRYSCTEGERWRVSRRPNPNVVAGAMVAGPDRDDRFLDRRDRPEHTEPTISGNAGLVAALVALLDHRSHSGTGGIDPDGIFTKIPHTI